MAVYRQKNKDGSLKSRIYYMKLQVRGIRVHQPTGKTTKTEALKVESAKRLELDREGKEAARKAKGAPCLTDFLFKDFLPYVESRFSGTPETAAYYRYGASLIDYRLGLKTLDEITDRQARDVEDWLRGKGAEVTTVNCALRTLRRALNLAAEWGRMPSSPKIRLAKGAHERTRVLSEQESEAYLNACEQPWRDAATVILGTGARPEEVRKARWQDIEWRKGGGIIYVQKGKTPSARRPLPMLPAVYAALRARHKSQGRPDKGWVFPSEKNPMAHWEQGSQKNWHSRALAKLAEAHAEDPKKNPDVAPFPPYTLRHTGLTRIAPYCDAFTLAKIAGHSSVAMTSKYVHPHQDSIEQAFQRFSESVRVDRQSL